MEDLASDWLALCNPRMVSPGTYSLAPPEVRG